MIQLVEKFINNFNYYPNSEELKDHYLSHPNYPSLFAITDTLDFFGIENVAARVEIDQYNDLPEQFLTLYNTKNGEQFVYVTHKDKDNVIFKDEENTIVQETKNQFITNWKEIIIVIDENEIIEKKKTITSKYQWVYLLILGFVLLLLNQWTLGYSIVSLVFSILSFAGLAISILILQVGFGLKSEITNKICSVTQTNPSGCNAVLSSEGAKIYKSYTFSDVCLVFFTTISFLCVFPITNFLFFVPISLLSVPILSFSVFYQMKVLKKWCALCLGISMVLIGIATSSLLIISEINLKSVILSTSIFVLSLLLFSFIWMILKPIINDYFELKKSDIDNKRFKRNITTFEALLNTTPKINSVSLDQLVKLEFGNKEATTELLLFLSPSCGHCHNAFNDAYNLFIKNKEFLKLSICFNVNIENENNPYRSVVEIITEVYLNQDQEKALNLLSEWHIKKTELELFSKKYATITSDKTKQILISHSQWCSENEFNYSPVKFFNKKLMPKEYNITDLQFFIKEYKED
jgi:hypothetical protein